MCSILGAISINSPQFTFFYMFFTHGLNVVVTILGEKVSKKNDKNCSAMKVIKCDLSYSSLMVFG
jgi:hypothetical protein